MWNIIRGNWQKCAAARSFGRYRGPGAVPSRTIWKPVDRRAGIPGSWIMILHAYLPMSFGKYPDLSADIAGNDRRVAYWSGKRQWYAEKYCYGAGGNALSVSSKINRHGILAVLFGIYSAGATLITGTLVGLRWGWHRSWRWQWVSSGGSRAYGLSCLHADDPDFRTDPWSVSGRLNWPFSGIQYAVFKSGPLLSAYPFPAALILVGFDMTKYNGATSPTNVSLALMGICFIMIITIVLLVNSGRYGKHLPAARKRQKAAAGEMAGTKPMLSRVTWSAFFKCFLYS